MPTPPSFPPVLVNRDRLRHEDLVFEIGCYRDEMIGKGHYLPSELHPYVDPIGDFAFFMYSYVHQVGPGAIYEATKSLRTFDNIVTALEELKLADSAQDLREFRPLWIADKDRWFELPEFIEAAVRAFRRFPKEVEFRNAVNAWAEGRPEIIYLPEQDYERELKNLVKLEGIRQDRPYMSWIETTLADQPNTESKMVQMVYQVVCAKLAPPVRLKLAVRLPPVRNIHGREVKVWRLGTDRGGHLHGVKMSEGVTVTAQTITAQMPLDISTPEARSAFVAGSLIQVDTKAVVALLERPIDRAELGCAVSLIRQAGLACPVTVTPYLDDLSKEGGGTGLRSFLIFLEDRTAVIMRLSSGRAVLFNDATGTAPVAELSRQGTQ